MLKKYYGLLFPEIRILFHGSHAEAYLNSKKVFFDFDSRKHNGKLFFHELARLRRTYLKYTLVKPKLLIDITGASGDKLLLKGALEKAVRRFDHVLAGFIDGDKRMIL